MKCKCGFTMPVTRVPDGLCKVCSQSMQYEADDYLLHGHGGIAREVRVGQVEMARLIERAFREKRIALAEGPVGTGKSKAYCVPAILHVTENTGDRVIIATAKKQLQHQLAQSELPFLAEKMGRPELKFVLYKGKSNYGCPKRAVALFGEGTQKKSKGKQALMFKGAGGPFLQWLAESTTCDLTEYRGSLPDRYWMATAEDCEGTRCPLATKCGFYQTRLKARAADIVVTNHHAVAFDLRYGPFKMFGEYKHLIFDEAHQAAAAFRGAWGMRLSRNKLQDVLNDLPLLATTVKYDTMLSEAAEPLFDKLDKMSGVVEFGCLGTQGEAIEEVLGEIHDEVSRAIRLEAGVSTAMTPDDDGGADMDEMPPELSERALELIKLRKSVKGMLAPLEAASKADTNMVLYVQQNQDGKCSLHIEPIELGPLIGPKLNGMDTVVVTSGTMANAGNFNDIKRQLGFLYNPVAGKETKPVEAEEKKEDAEEDVAATPLRRKTVEELVVASPFDFNRQAVLYLPKHLPMPITGGPSPQRSAYFDAVAKETALLLRESLGNAFILFTARADMDEVAERLRGYDLPFPMFCQEGDVEVTLRSFLDTPNSFVMGLKGFWEGVDVQGWKLRLVVIPKLPFPRPDDPVQVAQARRMEREESASGLQAFNTLMVPPMLTELRQGAGRLIRSRADRGVVAILDPRVWTGSGKRLPSPAQSSPVGYGATVVQALGIGTRTPQFADVKKYLEALKHAEEKQRAGVARP